MRLLYRMHTWTENILWKQEQVIQLSKIQGEVWTGLIVGASLIRAG